VVFMSEGLSGEVRKAAERMRERRKWFEREIGPARAGGPVC